MTLVYRLSLIHVIVRFPLKTRQAKIQSKPEIQESVTIWCLSWAFLISSFNLSCSACSDPRPITASSRSRARLWTRLPNKTPVAFMASTYWQRLDHNKIFLSGHIRILTWHRFGPTFWARTRCVWVVALRLVPKSWMADRPINVPSTRTSSISCQCSSYRTRAMLWGKWHPKNQAVNLTYSPDFDQQQFLKRSVFLTSIWTILSLSCIHSRCWCSIFFLHCLTFWASNWPTPPTNDSTVDMAPCSAASFVTRRPSVWKIS